MNQIPKQPVGGRTKEVGIYCLQQNINPQPGLRLVKHCDLSRFVVSTLSLSHVCGVLAQCIMYPQKFYFIINTA